MANGTYDVRTVEFRGEQRLDTLPTDWPRITIDLEHGEWVLDTKARDVPTGHHESTGIITIWIASPVVG